jgi:hypothetical protein
MIAIKKPHVHMRTSGLENPELQSRSRAAKKQIFVSREQLSSHHRNVAPDGRSTIRAELVGLAVS